MTIYKNIIIVSLLALVFLLPFLSARNFSPAFDEITHLPSGYTYLKTGEIKLNPQHPPLIKMLAAFPLLFLDLRFNPNDPSIAGPKVNEWQFGRDFLFSNGVDNLLFWGRLPIILLSVLLGWYIFKWGRELFGYWAGAAGLFVYAFMPNIIAHSQLITMDLGVAAFSFIAMYYLWKFTKHPTNRNIILSGLTLGLAMGSKFSAALLLPIFLFLLAVYAQNRHKDRDMLFKFNEFLKTTLPIFGLAFVAIWALYLFPKDPLFYWNGMQTVYADRNTEHLYYINGNFSRDGWWYYFLWAFIIKTPIPFLAVLFWATTCYRKLNLGFRNNSFIFLPMLLFLFVTSWKGHNIGVRYILPIYPFLILFVSGQVAKIFNFQFFPTTKPSRILDKVGTIFNKFSITNFKTILILALGGWYLLTGITTYPDYLAYFNELVGGSRNGYKHLDDSNIEWGHDLKRLAAYQKDNPDLKVFLWTDSNAYKFYGVENILSLNDKNEWLAPSGRYAVSVHVVARTKLMEKVYKDKLFNWADNYEPTDRIGRSFLVYEF